MKTYYTHNNGGRPFKVEVHTQPQHISVYKERPTYASEEYYSQPQYSMDYIRVFIGKSVRNAMTNFSGGFGPHFTGNSILIQPTDDRLSYVHVGCSLFSFRTLSPIVKYESPVGNNDVPYPYAIDEEDNYYLLIEGVILLSPMKPQNVDIYTYYYSSSRVPGLEMVVRADDPEEEETYWVSISMKPEEDYDRLVGSGQLYIRERETGRQTQYTKDEYVAYMQQLCATKGYQPLLSVTRLVE